VRAAYPTTASPTEKDRKEAGNFQWRFCGDSVNEQKFQAKSIPPAACKST
jgi:hypothetical protein